MENKLRRRRLYGPRPSDCGSDLLSLKEGFAELYPEAPHPITARGATVSWTVHVVMVHFRETFMCDLRYQLKRRLEEIETKGIKVDPMPQKINPITADPGAFRKQPIAVQDLKHIVADLVWLSHKGHTPAMVELVKISARDDVVRLTPRFAYYLLSVAKKAGERDPVVGRLLSNTTQHLTADERRELDKRVATKTWPLSERLVID